MAQALTALRRGALVKTPISIVIPSLADRELLAMALTPVLDEVQGRALGELRALLRHEPRHSRGPGDL